MATEKKTLIPPIPRDHIVNTDKSVRRKMIEESQEYYRGQLLWIFNPFFSIPMSGEKVSNLVEDTLKMANYAETLAAYIFEVPVGEFLQKQKENDPLSWKILCLKHFLHNSESSIEQVQRKLQERFDHALTDQEGEPVIVQSL